MNKGNILHQLVTKLRFSKKKKKIVLKEGWNLNFTLNLSFKKMLCILMLTKESNLSYYRTDQRDQNHGKDEWLNTVHAIELQSYKNQLVIKRCWNGTRQEKIHELS